MHPLLKIVYEDADLLVLDKPAGLLVHGDSRTDEPTLVGWLAELYPETRGVGEPMVDQFGTLIDRPGIVHRLDKDTSGVMVVAKTQAAYLHLKAQFQGREAKKAYRAILHGALKLEPGETRTIDVPIGRSRRDPRLRVARKQAPGRLREAVTDYRLIENLAGYAYVEACPRTGRTHQLRVHFKYAGHPIACDRLYAPGLPCPPGLGRQALHAWSLELSLPSGRWARFEAPLPADMQAALDKLKSLC